MFIAGTVYLVSSQVFASVIYIDNQIVEISEENSLNDSYLQAGEFTEDDFDLVVEESNVEEVILEDHDELEVVEEIKIEDQKKLFSDNKSIIVPFYSQFNDITSIEWKKVGCGIASLAMIIDYYKSSPPSVDKLLDEGIRADAYLNDAGWTYAGLIGVSKKYGFTGQSHDLASLAMDNAFNSLEKALMDGPVMVSVHYKFEPTNPIPHLVIANSVHDGMIYYNDPAEETGNLSMPVSKFKKAWKKRYIEIRPVS